MRRLLTMEGSRRVDVGARILRASGTGRCWSCEEPVDASSPDVVSLCSLGLRVAEGDEVYVHESCGEWESAALGEYLSRLDERKRPEGGRP